jgi:hypothetical protein
VWTEPGSKQPGNNGFDSRRARHHYVIARRDLPVGVLAAQIIHAAGESSPGDLPTGTIAVALGAKSESHLGFIEAKLRRSSIPHRAIREPDAPWNGALMAIGIHPVEDREPLRKVTSGLPLIK